MSAPKVEKKGSAFTDDESKGVIYEGANMSQLMTLFKLDYRTVQRKVFESGVKPAGKRYGADIYSVAEIAPYLVKPVVDVETYIRKMHHSELPKMLTKEYWAGQREKQNVLERSGHLWSTEKIVEKVGELLKIVKMSTLLMLDAVERQSELSPRQRDIIKNLARGLLTDIQQRIQADFKNPEEETPSHVERQEAQDEQEL